MKSSPRLNETPLSTGSKTPAGGKKLVQARLPFKTLGGTEPPLIVSNDTSETSLADAHTLTPTVDNRKRKQNDSIRNGDGVCGAKLNACEYKSSENIPLESNEILELSNDITVDSNEAENSTKFTNENRTSECKENFCVDKHTSDKMDLSDSCSETVEDFESGTHESKAKQSLDFEKMHPESRKTKRSNESSLITIKLPMTKKSKELAKKAKKHRKRHSDTQINDDEKVETADEGTALAAEEEEKEEENKQTDSKENVDFNTSMVTTEQEVDKLNESYIDNDDNVLDESIVSNPSEQCLTPSNISKLTPKQVQKRLESEKKKQEKEMARLERERKLQEEKELRQHEKEEKELQKKREREEKDEQRKKEKEMREKKLLDEKLEKQREKELKEQQRKIEREEKEEQRKREREEKELQKKREREEKEREKEEERKKKEDEKRQKLEAEQSKNRKTVEAFAKFFVPKKVENKSDLNELGEYKDCDQMPQTFMSFQIKEDMKVAPVIRRTLNRDERSAFEHMLSSGSAPNDLYLSQLKCNMFAPRKTVRTWLDDDDDKFSNDDLFVTENGQNVQAFKEEPKKLYRAKFFKFDENRRPPYYGTWRKKSKTIHARKPLALDSQLDYDVDSDDEWEEEEPGESLHGSDDEKEVESEDEYEIDNEFFVPHGHLSDEELQNEDEPEFNNPADLKIKLKLAQNEFDDECKKKTQKLKPRLIGFIWQNMDGSKPDNCSNRVWELMNKSAMLFNGPTVRVERPNNMTTDNSDDENLTTNKPLGVRRLQIGEKDIPDLIRLINGNQNNSKFLVKEFCAFLAKNNQLQREYSSAGIKAKIKDLAIWQACPEEGPMYKKLCWYVPIDTRKRYNLHDLSFPNTWSYTIPPRRPVEIISTDGNSKMIDNKESEKIPEPQDSIQMSDDSNSCNFASEVLTPELIKQASSKRTNYNIAKFVRVLTQDEKQKQFEPITFNGRLLDDQMNNTPPTSQMIENKSKKVRATKRSATSTPDSTVPKKRINLLMSGPLGHEISPKIKTNLVTQYLNSNAKKRTSTILPGGDTNALSLTNTAGTSDGAKETKLNDSNSIIIID